MLEEHVRNISREIEEYRKSQDADPINALVDPINTLSDPIKKRLLHEIRQGNSLNYAGYGALLGVSEATVKRRLNEMKKDGLIVRIGSNKSGRWTSTRK